MTGWRMECPDETEPYRSNSFLIHDKNWIVDLLLIQQAKLDFVFQDVFFDTSERTSIKLVRSKWDYYEPIDFKFYQLYFIRFYSAAIEKFEIRLSVGPGADFFTKYTFEFQKIMKDTLHKLDDYFHVVTLFVNFKTNQSDYMSRKIPFRYYVMTGKKKRYSPSIKINLKIYNTSQFQEPYLMFELEMTGWRMECPEETNSLPFNTFLIHDKNWTNLDKTDRIDVGLL
ncbi:hypothetical protein RF11_15359 [Thelohanellus kitauei]|uniref:Uncharacterized protein n=1 Tax=Thelohanellus kitauei TaxID=669202 RepID=A0A0C2MEZ5_THEKT|nr:hypothetical protein RF11_15359 [Thelohanellus kitauei]